MPLKPTFSALTFASFISRPHTDAPSQHLAPPHADSTSPDPARTHRKAKSEPPSFLRSLARMSVQAQAIAPTHMARPMLTSPNDMLYTKGSVEQPEPVKWWTELSHVDGAPHPHLGSGAESPRSSTVDLTARSAARQALFSKATFPLVLDTIVSHAAHADRLSLRLVCRRVAAHTDAALFRTLTVTTHGFRSADGTLPLVNLWRRPDVAGAVRSLTITDEWDDWTALAHVFPGLAPDVIRVPASCPLDILGLQASTVIAFGDVVSATTSDWLRVHSLPLPISTDAAIDDLAGPSRLVYTVRHGDPDLLLVTLPDNWSLPDTVHTLVVHIAPHPNPRPALTPEVFNRAHTDDGAHTYLKNPRRSGEYGLTASPLTTVKGLEWLHAAKGHLSFLDRLASVVAANLRPGRMFTLVAPEAWDERWLCAAPGQSTITYRFFYAVVRHARRHHRWNGRYAERAVADAIRFVSEDEYRSEIGEVVWRLETELEA
ncbi:hypothetical protein CC85DRAFT_328644 [Cutaneotrichosporon oleaginosum]|uniref:Uncharacterized protein n=1 Tax=Cutaneotrichosporon oleaginosum TaxID=879819 RepID=A0A0J1B2W1_9TREE|nr:uncharacterized protein CC85DRAFT_328644 [Cutaneotrichosporon oleaginosum]KLT41934.1 hypothetical protein CC85DRAFT_328644 [Cutaneotrichosporon oleaginosum]TXT12534.1 hypothetical protein COLE_02944 [Cutaneotrichosporon oleaginosum]